MRHNWTNLGQRTTVMTLTAVVCATTTLANSIQEDGRAAFEQRCTGCHTLDKIKVGPPLRACMAAKREETPCSPIRMG